MENPSFLSSAWGSGGGLSSISTTFARICPVLVLQLLEMVIVTSPGSEGVCHFTQAS